MQSHICSAGEMLISTNTNKNSVLQANWPSENGNQKCFKSGLSFMLLMSSHFEDSSLLACYALSAGKYLPTFRTRTMLPHSNKNTPDRVGCLALGLKDLQIFKMTVTIYISRHALVSEKLRFLRIKSIITANLVF